MGDAQELRNLALMDQNKTEQARQEARERAQTCGQEIAEVLRKHKCRILPFIAQPEWIGDDGAKALIQASYGIVPDIEDEAATT